MKVVSEHSAGGAVYKKLQVTSNLPRRQAGKLQVMWLVCKHSGYHQWVLPKGIVEEGEDPRVTAVREVLEETGVKAEIIKKIPTEVTYKYTKNGTLIDKRVEFYLMKYLSGDIKDHSWEMEDVKWVSAEEALKLLAFETERKTLKKASAMV